MDLTGCTMRAKYRITGPSHEAAWSDSRVAFAHFLDRANRFRALFGLSSGLIAGRDEFEALSRQPGITAYHWHGVRGGLAVEGDLTPEAKELFKRYVIVEGTEPLWIYGLYEGDDPLLFITDWNGCDVFLDQHDVNALIAAGLRPESWHIYEASGISSEPDWYTWQGFHYWNDKSGREGKGLG
jgi:hypothetical protein